MDTLSLTVFNACLDIHNLFNSMNYTDIRMFFFHIYEKKFITIFLLNNAMTLVFLATFFGNQSDATYPGVLSSQLFFLLSFRQRIVLQDTCFRKKYAPQCAR